MLDEDHYLDGGGKWYRDSNFGNFPQDGFDELLYNADIVTQKAYSGDKWLPWAIIVAKENLCHGHEVFVKDGTHYWLWKPNFDSLPDDQKEKCRLFYKIEDDEFFKI